MSHELPPYFSISQLVSRKARGRATHAGAHACMCPTLRSFFFVSVLLSLVTVMARLSITVTLLVLLLASSISVSSQAPANLKSNSTLAVTDSGRWKVIQKGVEFRTIALERSEPSQSIDLKLLRFDTQWILPRVLRSSQFQLKGATAKTFAEKSGALATINANY